VNTENTDIEAEANGDNDIEKPQSELPEKPSDEPVDPPRRPDPKPLAEPGKPAKRGGALAFLAFLFSLAALAGTAWMWWQEQSSQGTETARLLNEISRLESTDSEVGLKLKQLRNELDMLASGDVSAEFNELQARLQADRAQVDSVERAMQEQLALSRSLQAATDSIQGRLQAAEAAVSGMSTRELDAGGELDLAEVDYLLRLANERVKLFADPAAADQALEVADMHLAALDNPMYLGVRQDIATVRRELAAVTMPDFLAIAGQLDELQQKIPALPFQDDVVPEQESTDIEGDGWWEKLKGAFSGLVTVRRSSEQENQRISLQDKDFVRQRVWLQLEIAHLALMRRDQAAFRGSLARARETIDTWFDPADPTCQQVAAELDGLASLPIEVDVPDITAPWSTLRLLRNATGAARPVAVPMPEEPLQAEPQAAPGDEVPEGEAEQDDLE